MPALAERAQKAVFAQAAQVVRGIGSGSRAARFHGQRWLDAGRQARGRCPTWVQMRVVHVISRSVRQVQRPPAWRPLFPSKARVVPAMGVPLFPALTENPRILIWAGAQTSRALTLEPASPDNGRPEAFRRTGCFLQGGIADGSIYRESSRWATRRKQRSLRSRSRGFARRPGKGDSKGSPAGQGRESANRVRSARAKSGQGAAGKTCRQREESSDTSRGLASAAGASARRFERNEARVDPQGLRQFAPPS